MKADDGKTLHAFRLGCAITVAVTGADLSDNGTRGLGQEAYRLILLNKW